MNNYTTQELADLFEILELAKITSGAVDSPDSALLNVHTIIYNYRKEGPEKIKSKILEFANIGKLAQDSSVIHPYNQIYLLLYEYPLEEVPKYLDTPYDILAVWRLSLPNQIKE